MRYLLQDFFLMDVDHRFQVLIFFCLLVLLVLMVLILKIIKKAKDKK